ncbi:hypothetical protein FAUST_6206 [Fusarium austroamericanum]|uniref:Uncharacterized protein n=1 Tax=Fusarium austroamericanum TaxID=282268 RepID=A0AAN6HCV5_FUSAU|nr:hypothetical protein FAUST_6206 [Fusarium austroamericanum]
MESGTYLPYYTSMSHFCSGQVCFITKCTAQDEPITALVATRRWWVSTTSFFRKFEKILYPGRVTIPYQWKGILKGTRSGLFTKESSSSLGYQSLSTLRPSRESPSPFTNGSRNSRTKVDWRKLATGHIDGFPFSIHGHSVDDNGNISFQTQWIGDPNKSSSSGTGPSARRSSVLGRIQRLQNSDDGTEFRENGQQFQAPGGEEFDSLQNGWLLIQDVYLGKE